MKLAARVGEVLGSVRRFGAVRMEAIGLALTIGLVGTAGVLLYATKDGAKAQAWPSYYNSAYNPSDLPGMRLSMQHNLVDPASAFAFYGSPTSPTAAAPSARITALARALENDPDRIYQFVYNSISFEPQFGLHKGADGVLLDGSGGAFDQSQLMIELLRASSINARYVLGVINLNSADAKSILRVETGRQACILLASAGAPASINGTTTSCASLGAPLTTVQMAHVWVEAQIGGTWYAFDPSLKTTTKITGIDIWGAAGTTASGAWSNVSSGVSVSSGSLNGVNTQNIQNDLIGYATALQTNLINNHSDKSLKQLAGGWDIVRTEAVLRNATLPRQASVSTRWTGGVPTPYRATLQVQTAGFNHTFDLPSIYGWRVQAQIQGNRLKVAVRNQEHVDATATAYFSGYLVANECAAPVVCGAENPSDFATWNRRVNLTVNHPYAARRPGTNPADNNNPWALGTFADETIVKQLEIGKRADILVRTAGGNGGRKAAWAAAHDPIQQHRILPAGNDLEQCYVNYPVWDSYNSVWITSNIEPSDCNGQSGPDWTYWVQDSQYGNGPFAYGEVAVAEMGTKKDSLVNGWTDLFDKTVSVLEPLSGARIFHQHSVGLAISPGYTENVLDIDTSVGVAANGTDLPHHILSALASLAVTEEALALNQSATERPLFQGAPFQATAPRRMSTATALKVLTTAGSTSTLPADVTADTKAEIEKYLAKGFSVVATTTANGNAFLARRNDGSEQAWILRSQRLGQTPDVDPRTYFLKGAESEAPNPVDYLGKAESRRLAANVAGSLLGAVDLRTGTLSFSEGSELSMGQGEFPYSLSFSRSYVSTGPIESTSGLGMGWTHNWESSVGHSTDVGALLPEAETVTAAPMLIGALIALQAGRADTIEAAVVSGIALDWLQEHTASNVVNVNGGGQSGRFVRLVDGTWRNPASPTESLAPVGASFIGPSTTKLTWTLADRSVMTFDDMENQYSGTESLGRKGILKTWAFPTGVLITLAYGEHDNNNAPVLTSVSNNLGASLTFTHSKAGTDQQVQTCQSSAPSPSDPSYAGEMQECHEYATNGGRLTKVQAGQDEISFFYNRYCPQFVNFCTSQLSHAVRPGLRTRQYIYDFPTGALQSAAYAMDYQQVLTQVIDAGVATPRARFDWRAVGGQVAPYVAEAFDAQNRKTTYYSSTWTYSSAKDATNAVIRQTYDEDGRMAASADPMGRTSRATYDGPGRSKTIKTPWGDVTSFTYDKWGNLRERKQSPIADCEVGLSLSDQERWCQEIVIKADYANASWPTQPTRIILPSTAVDPVERHWDLTYNAKGLVDTMTGPEVQNGLAPGVSMERPVWRTWYDAYGRVNRTQDPTGIESSMTYGGGGLPAFCLRLQVASSQAGGENQLTTMGCDAVGNVTTVMNARNFTTTAAYDALRRKISETGPAGTGIQIQWDYDLNGDQWRTKQWDSTTATWQTTTTVFSATHQPLTVTDQSGDVSRTCYDAVDRPVTVIDGEGRATHTVYNHAGQPTEIHRFQRAAAGSCSISTELPYSPNQFTETRWRRFQYNSAGLQSAEIDARGNVTQQLYDGLGRPVKTIYADNAEAWTAMDERGQAVARKQRGGSQAMVIHDAIGRDFHVREFAAGEENYLFKGRNSRASYDLAGRPVWRDVSTQTTTGATFNDALRRDIRNYEYDTAGRLETEQWRPEGTAGISFTIGYGYDDTNNRTSIVWPGAWTAAYTYDSANRIQTVTFPGAGGSVTITHDSLSRRTGINRPGAAADTSYTYEPDSDLASLSHAFVAGSGPGAVSFSYGHDASGKTTTIGISQPVFEWMPTLSYDETYGAANVLNQISSAGGVSIAWTPDGNMESDGINNYTWGYGNRLIGASRAGMTAAYAYDSDDRRTKKTVNSVVTRTLWSGADELAEYDINGTLLRRFVPDGTGAMDARLATVEVVSGQPDAVYWHHVDHQGSVIATSDSTGKTVGTASYSPYGEFSGSQTAPPLYSPFGYTGRQYDPETQLYQYRARYYSPKLGQFLSMDPIGTKDDPNLYLYVGLDPVNETDPTGECIASRINTKSGSVCKDSAASKTSSQAQDRAPARPAPTRPAPARPGSPPAANDNHPPAANDNAPRGRPRLRLPRLPRWSIVDQVEAIIRNSRQSRITVYRVCDDVRAMCRTGRSWTPEDPRTLPNWRDRFAVYPNWNGGTRLAIGTITANDLFDGRVRPSENPGSVAGPMPYNAAEGGGPYSGSGVEWIIDNPQATVRSMRVIRFDGD